MPTIHISYYSKDWRGAILSNLYPTPFVYDGVRLMCVESFVQAINFQEDDSRHLSCFELSGPECKAMMYEAEEEDSSLVYWKGRELDRGSDQHFQLLEDVLRCKFLQNDLVREALEDTLGCSLVYDVPDAEQRFSFPPGRFVTALTEIREDILRVPKGR